MPQPVTPLAPVASPAGFAAAATLNLLPVLLQQLQQQGLLSLGRVPNVVLAYSGGVDSTVLLHLLAQAQNQGLLQVTAAYYHHAWRGTPAPELARVHKNCTAFRVPLVFLPPHPSEGKTEQGARKHRYHRLLHLAHTLGADALLTAHQEDDQLETLVFRLLRGTGLEGLQGIHSKLQWQPQGWPHTTPPPCVVRPLLATPRAQLVAYAQQHQLHYFEDPTNQQTRLARNALRHHVLPQVHERFPHGRQALLRFSEVALGDLTLLQELTQQQWETLSVSLPALAHNSLGWALCAQRWVQLSAPLQRRLMRQLCHKAGVEASLGRCQRLLQWLSRQVGPTQRYARKIALPSVQQGHAYFLVCNGSHLWVEAHAPATADWQQQLATNVPCPLLGGIVALPWQPNQGLRMAPWPKRGGLFDLKRLPTAKSLEVFVNARAYESEATPLVVRTRQAGDWIRPLGMGGVKVKLKDVLINQQVPLTQRGTLPLVACGQEVLWVPGVALSEGLKVAKDKAPTHTWSVGPLEALNELKTLRFLMEDEGDDEADDDEPETDSATTAAGGEGGLSATDAEESSEEALNAPPLVAGVDRRQRPRPDEPPMEAVLEALAMEAEAEGVLGLLPTGDDEFDTLDDE